MKKAVLYGAIAAVAVIFIYNKNSAVRQALGGPA